MTGLIIVVLMVALMTATTRLRVVETRMHRPLAGCGQCDPEAGCGHMHYGAACPRCGCAALVV